MGKYLAACVPRHDHIKQIFTLATDETAVFVNVLYTYLYAHLYGNIALHV